MPTAPVPNNKPTFKYIKIDEHTSEKLQIKGPPPPTLTKNYNFLHSTKKSEQDLKEKFSLIM